MSRIIKESFGDRLKRMKSLLPTPEGRIALAKELLSIKNRELSWGERRFLDYSQNWSKRLEEDKQRLIEAQAALRSLEALVLLNNVIPIRNNKAKE